MIKNIGKVCVFVHDFERSIKFFRDTLCLPLKEQHGAIDAEFFKSGTILEIGVANSEEERKMIGRHTGIAFKVKDINKICERLKLKRVKFSEPLHTETWGKIAVFKDPDGNQFAIMETRRKK